MTSWQKAEEAIFKEATFLKNNVHLAPYRQNEPIKCNDCLFRLIAILIVSGKVKVRKIHTSSTLWAGIEHDSQEKMHGSFWHNSTIKNIEKYFSDNNFETITEPSMVFGRADVGILSLSLFFEIGTINLYKLYYNLVHQSDIKICLIPSDKYIIEFTT